LESFPLRRGDAIAPSDPVQVLPSFLPVVRYLDGFVVAAFGIRLAVLGAILAAMLWLAIGWQHAC